MAGNLVHDFDGVWILSSGILVVAPNRQIFRPAISLYGTGTIVILDSGFCVLQSLVELRKVGVYPSTVIKKRRYWPRHIDGDAIDAHMSDKAVGATDALQGTLDGFNYTIFAMKEPDYTMKMMSTYGGLIIADDQPDTFRTIDGGNISFKYAEPFANHYFARHAVDDHNNLRQGKISLEETWKTHQWEFRVLAFILALVEVNTYNAFRYFVWTSDDQKHPDFMAFRKMLAKALVLNDYLTPREEERRRTRSSNVHELVKAPKHARKFTSAGWDMTSKKAYQQYTCSTPGCKTMIRTYCSCSVGVWMCGTCHIKHVVEATREE